MTDLYKDGGSADNNFDEKLYEEKFTRQIIKYGRLTNLLAVPLCFLPALVMAVVYKSVPAAQDIIGGWILIFSIYGIYSIVEPVSYFPVLGLPGTYMGFLSGNIGNMRVPCSAIAQEAVGVEPGSKKAELVSTLGIAGSIITNTIVVTVAALAGSAIMSILPPIVLEAFKFVSTGIFAATFAMYAVKKPILALYVTFMALFLIMVVKVIPVYIMIPFIVFTCVALGFFIQNQEDRRNENINTEV